MLSIDDVYFLQPSSSGDHPIGSTPQLHTTQEEHKAPTVANGGTRRSLVPSPRLKHLSSPALSLVGGGSSPRLAPSPGYSPTVIPRRYKLAAALVRDAGTQTDTTCVVTEKQNQSDQSNEGKTSDQSNEGKRSDQSNEGKRSDQSNPLPPNIVDALATAKADVLRIQKEKEVRESVNGPRGGTDIHHYIITPPPPHTHTTHTHTHTHTHSYLKHMWLH